MTTVNDIVLGTAEVTAYICKDGGNYVIYSTGKGGAMIVAPTKDEAKKKFNEALNMVFALRNLMFYDAVLKADDQAKIKFAKEYKPTSPAIHFIESAAEC
jgi:hypothetical protein